VLRFVPVSVIAPVLRTALHLHTALYQTFDTSTTEIIRHFIVSNLRFNSIFPQRRLSAPWGEGRRSVCVSLCNRFYAGPCHWFWGRIILLLFPIWPSTRYSLSRGLLTTHSNTLYRFGSHVVPFLSQFDHWLVSDTTQFTGTRDFSCSYNAACVRDRTPRASGEAHSCQDQIFKVCKATVLFNLWEAFVDIFVRLLKPLWLELYVLKCQVHRYFVLTVVGVIKKFRKF
jgi:hypothetical protein